MKIWIVLITSLIFGTVVADVSAWPRRRMTTRYSTSSTTTTSIRYSSPAEAAAGKAARCASSCRMAHLSGGYGGGRAEGVGRGSSPAAALANCCFTGQRPLLASAVRQGRDGMWYAVKIFR